MYSSDTKPRATSCNSSDFCSYICQAQSLSNQVLWWAFLWNRIWDLSWFGPIEQFIAFSFSGLHGSITTIFFKEFGKYSHFLFDYYTTPTTTWFSAFDHVCEIVSSRLYYWERQKWCCRYLVLFHNLPIFLDCNSVPALMCKLCITLSEWKVT
jgi:hypothetical protein